MKLLGKFAVDEGNRRMDFLKSHNIVVEAEDVFDEHVSFKGSTSVVNNVSLYVSEKDYESAVGFFREHEAQQQKAAEVYAAEIQRGFFRIMIALMVLLGLVACIGGLKGWW